MGGGGHQQFNFVSRASTTLFCEHRSVISDQQPALMSLPVTQLASVHADPSHTIPTQGELAMVVLEPPGHLGPLETLDPVRVVTWQPQ